MLTVSQVAARLHVSPMRVRQWIAARRMRATRVGPLWLVDESDAVRPAEMKRGPKPRRRR